MRLRWRPPQTSRDVRTDPSHLRSINPNSTDSTDKQRCISIVLWPEVNVSVRRHGAPAQVPRPTQLPTAQPPSTSTAGQQGISRVGRDLIYRCKPEVRG